MSVPYAKHAKTAKIAANVNGLETLDEGNGIGWRLVDRNAAFYGDIGENAVDLSYSNSGLILKGALGLNSFATGFFTTASGDYATSMGFNTEALGDYSTSLGFNTETLGDYSIASGRNSSASGEYATALGYFTNASNEASTALGYNTTASEFASTAMGFETEASGSHSTAFGYQTESSGNSSTSMGLQSQASGNYSTAIGYATDASGNISTTMGFSTIASAAGSTAIGAYNIGGGTPNLWISTYPLFEIGNGTTNEDRSNALTVLKNGNVGIGTNTPQERLHIFNGRLRIGNETIEDGGTDILAFSSSLVPTVDGVDRLGGPNRRWFDVWATDGTINMSDRREKENIKNLNYGLSEILQMNPVSFNWINKNNPDTKLGLIAQDVLKIVPEVVKTHIWEKDEVYGVLTKKELDRLGVYYSDLVPVLIKAIQEQHEIISSQKNINLQQKTELQKLNQNFEALVSRIEILETNSSN